MSNKSGGNVSENSGKSNLFEDTSSQSVGQGVGNQSKVDVSRCNVDHLLGWMGTGIQRRTSA
jgi:hypothetical protein